MPPASLVDWVRRGCEAALMLTTVTEGPDVADNAAAGAVAIVYSDRLTDAAWVPPAHVLEVAATEIGAAAIATCVQRTGEVSGQVLVELAATLSLAIVRLADVRHCTREEAAAELVRLVEEGHS